MKKILASTVLLASFLMYSCFTKAIQQANAKAITPEFNIGKTKIIRKNDFSFTLLECKYSAIRKENLCYVQVINEYKHPRSVGTDSNIGYWNSIIDSSGYSHFFYPCYQSSEKFSPVNFERLNSSNNSCNVDLQPNKPTVFAFPTSTIIQKMTAFRQFLFCSGYINHLA